MAYPGASVWPAWFTWLMVHLVFIISSRNRISVLFNWEWTYLFYMRGSRLITGTQELQGQSVVPASDSLHRSLLGEN